jgi:riboflavin biosynthesis pyrimidine reductase
LLVTSTGRAPRGAELIRLPTRDGIIPPADIVAALFARGLRKLLIEGGAKTISAFLDADCLDRLHIMMAPVIIGSGRPGLDLAPVAALAQARRPRTHAYLLGDGEVLFDCALRETGVPATPPA